MFVPTNMDDTPLSEAKFLKPETLQKLLGYSDRGNFWSAVRKAQIPYIRINARRCLFEESAVKSWLAARTVGSASGRAS